MTCRVIAKQNNMNMVEISKISTNFPHNICGYDYKNLCPHVYNYMRDNNFNPISYDIQCTYNNIYYSYHDYKIYIEFNNINECWECFRFINKKTNMHCILREYIDNDNYTPSSLYRRLPYCHTCIKRRATHCKMLYCKVCARNQDTFSKTFYEIPTELFSDIIIKYLKIADICSLQQCCKEMNSYFNDNNIWRPYISNTVWFKYIPYIPNQYILYKIFYMNRESTDMKRMKTKSAVIIQKYMRRIINKRNIKLLIRDSLSVLTNYYHLNDYTRSPTSTFVTGTDLLTKNTHMIFIEKLKIREAYAKSLQAIEEPVFD